MENILQNASVDKLDERMAVIRQSVQQLSFAQEKLRSLGYTICDSTADKKQLGDAVLSMANWFRSLTNEIDSDINHLANQKADIKEAM